MEKDRGDDRSGTGGKPHRKGRLPLGARIPSGRLLHGDIFPPEECPLHRGQRWRGFHSGEQQ